MPREQAEPLYMDFIASSGRTIDEDGNLNERMPLQVFAHLLGYTKQALYYWADTDPEWDAKVLRRIPIIFGNPKHIARVVSGLFISASSGNERNIDTYLRNFYKKEYISPNMKLEHDIGNNLADLIMNAAKRRKDERPVIDADSTTS